MATKVNRIITYLEWVLPMGSHGPLIKCSFRNMRQTKTINSPLSQCQWPPNLAGSWLIVKGSYSWPYTTFTILMATKLEVTSKKSFSTQTLKLSLTSCFIWYGASCYADGISRSFNWVVIFLSDWNSLSSFFCNFVVFFSIYLEWFSLLFPSCRGQNGGWISDFVQLKHFLPWGKFESLQKCQALSSKEILKTFVEKYSVIKRGEIPLIVRFG